MEFRLLYSGRLLGASKSNTRATLKHSIRREFHPQLQRLWRTHPLLIEYATAIGRKEMSAFYSANPADVEQSFNDGVNAIGANWNRGKYNFVPLTIEQLCLRCSLNILFLRPEEPGMIIRSGDLDARLKTVFDALKVPQNVQEIGDDEPQTGENPFFCLFSDDKLISEIQVTTDHLLLLPGESQPDANAAFLVIHVRLSPTRPARYSWAFE